MRFAKTGVIARTAVMIFVFRESYNTALTVRFIIVFVTSYHYSNFFKVAVEDLREDVTYSVHTTQDNGLSHGDFFVEFDKGTTKAILEI